MKIQKIQQIDFPAAQEFYSSVGYSSQIRPDDIVLSAYDDDKIVGLVRLAHEQGAIVLRGMMIAPSQQKKGLGTSMIKKLEESIGNRDCYCLPYDYLDGFYGQIGFKKIDDHLAPQHLRERIVENRKKYPQLIVMKRWAQNV